jgi:hypothetical protein
MTRRAQPEQALQRAIRDWLAIRGFDSVHVPNGSKLAGTPQQRARAGARLKADGLRPGFPDLLVYGSGGRIGHIEVKAPGGYQQPTQRRCQEWLLSIGHRYAVCRSTEDADAALVSWGWLAVDNPRARLVSGADSAIKTTPEGFCRASPGSDQNTYDGGA